MEFVEGGSLDRMVQGAPMPGGPAGHLVENLARAVGVAHAKGIVHRDLKPQNILLSGVPKPESTNSPLTTHHSPLTTPKITDFGLAKRVGDEQVQTHTGAILGTPSYMAPEQASGQTSAIGPAADVYALGAILYECLTGRPPFRSESGLATMEQVLRDEPVPPQRLNPRVPRDLETICLKCLRKQPVQRYASAQALADDLGRFCRGEPIQARPVGRLERLWRWCQRQPALATVSAALILVVIGSLGALTGLWLEATAQRDRARNNERTARAAQQESETRLAQVQKTNDILGSIFEKLDPREEVKEGKPLQALLGERLDQAMALLEGEAIGEPLMVAKMQFRLGQTQLGLGYPDKAKDMLQKARRTYEETLGPDHPDTLTVVNALARAHHDAGQLDPAVALYAETLERRNASLGPDDPATLESLANLALAYKDAGQLDRALPLQVEVFEREKAQHGPDHPTTLSTMNNLALAYQAAGKLDKALPLFEEAVQRSQAHLAPNHPQTLMVLANLGLAYIDARQLDRAVKVLQDTLARAKAKLGPDHPETLTYMHNLAQAYSAAGKLDLAQPLYEDAIAKMKLRLGPDHRNTLLSMNDLTLVYKDTGRLDRALALSEDVVKQAKARFGPDHPETLTSMSNLAMLYQDAGKMTLALPLCEETVRRMKAKLGPDHPNTLTTMEHLAVMDLVSNQLDKALALYEEALARRKAKQGPDHPATLRTLNYLGSIYWRVRRFDRSVPLLEEAYRLEKARLGENHPETLLGLANLGVNYKDSGRLAQGTECLERAWQGVRRLPDFHAFLAWVPMALANAYEQARYHAKAQQVQEDQLKDLRSRLPADHPTLTSTQARFATWLLQQKKYAEAEVVLQECLAARVRKELDVWTTFNTRSLLGEALAGQTKYSEAEPLLLDGYEGMDRRQATIPPEARVRLAEARQRLVKLYSAWGKTEQEAQWRKKAEAAKDGKPKTAAAKP
jgi:tetratricopeptide (TPR) repeat protein